jgi:hypothetical protein
LDVYVKNLEAKMVNGDPDDLSDSQSRDELRHHRVGFGRAKWSRPDSLYLSRWIPSPSHTSTPGDLFMAVLGAIMLVGIIGAVVVANFWR